MLHPPPISLIIGNRLPLASMTFPESQRADSRSCLLGKRGDARPGRNKPSRAAGTFAVARGFSLVAERGRGWGCVCRGYSLVVVSRFLIALASLVAEHKLYVVWLVGSRAQAR